METDNATAVTDQHTNYMVSNNDNSSISEKGKSVKEEHYDAIMMVQNPRSDLGSVASAMWANEEDGGVQLLGCMAITAITARYAAASSPQTKRQPDQSYETVALHVLTSDVARQPIIDIVDEG